MKVCNLETVITFEDILRMSDYICTEAPQLVITPSFSWIKNSLQEISVNLFHAEQEKAIQTIRLLKTRCMDFASTLISDPQSCNFAKENIELRFTTIGQLAHNTLNLLDDRELLISGEYISSILITAYLKSKGINAALLDASEFIQLGADNKPDLEAISSQAQTLTNLIQASVYVTQSRVCKNAYGETEYLPKGGADIYAMYIAAAFHAEEVTLWLHTKGIYTQYGENVYKGESNYALSFEEAESFINAGIRLISPQCISLACEHKITIRLMDSKSINKRSICITNELPEERHSVKAVIARKNIDYIRLRSLGTVSSFQFLEKSLSIFSKYKVPVYLMTSSSANISMAVELSMDTFYLIRHELSSLAEIVIENNIASICVLGQFNWSQPSVESKIIELLRDIPILMISYGSDNNSVSVAVREKDREQALCILSDNFLGTDFTKQDGIRLFHEEYNAFII